MTSHIKKRCKDAKSEMLAQLLSTASKVTFSVSAIIVLIGQATLQMGPLTLQEKQRKNSKN